MTALTEEEHLRRRLRGEIARMTRRSAEIERKAEESFHDWLASQMVQLGPGERRSIIARIWPFGRR